MEPRLGLCSAYSLLYGVHPPGKLLDKAASLGAGTVAICDLNNLYGVHSFLEAAKERGLRPLIGAALTRGKETEAAVYCLVEDRAGFGRLCEILTRRNHDKSHFDPLPLLAEDAGGLVLASPKGPVLESLFGKVQYLYGAISPGSTGAAEVSRRRNLPLCVLDNALFLEKEDFAVHRALRAMGLLKTVGSLGPGDTAEPGRIMRPGEDIRRALAAYPGAFRGTREIAERCRFHDLFAGWVFPGYETGERTGAEELRRRVYEGAAERYGELGDRELERLDYELDII
jgi:DNA polymerase-3 subunit alpha/error-prone DNA polymerase